jgi:hypothetical protein
MDHASHLVDIVNEDGTVASTKTRQEIDKKTDLYHTVFVILKTPANKVVLSKIPDREDLPNLYAGTLGPTVSTIRRHEETDDEAGMRAVKRELYIEDLSLTKLGEDYLVLPDGHRKYMSVYLGTHSLPSEFSHEDIESLNPLNSDEIEEQLKTKPEIIAPTFQAIWQKYKKDLK